MFIPVSSKPTMLSVTIKHQKPSKRVRNKTTKKNIASQEVVAKSDEFLCIRGVIIEKMITKEKKMTIYEKINDQIELGYDYMYQHETTKCCDEWLAAWEEVKTVMKEAKINNIIELNKEKRFSEFIINYAQELMFELHNAGIEDASYYEKRIIYCTELLTYCGDDQNIKENTRRGIGESYTGLGDMETCDRLFEGWLQEDPDWGWGYIGWSDSWYLYKEEGGNFEKAEQILLQGLSQEEVRDRIDLVARMAEINEKAKKPEKVREYKALLHKLMPTTSKTSSYYKPSPLIKPPEPGRNAPCPCGSGQKYKRCCGVQKVG